MDTQWTADHLKDPKVRVFEVSVDQGAFDQGHIPGAVALNWFHDLEEHPHRDVASKATIERLLGSAGVTAETTIVVYGDNNNWFAKQAVGKRVRLDLVSQAIGGPVRTGRIVGVLEAVDGMVVTLDPDDTPGCHATYHAHYIKAIHPA